MMGTTYYLGFSLVFCLLHICSAATLTENGPIYGKLVSFAEKEVANGHPHVVNGVYSKEMADQENVFVVRLEVKSNPSMLCAVTIDASSDSYSVIDKACQKEVNEETIVPEKRPVSCAGCVEEGDIADPLAIKAAEEALNHYNSRLGDEMGHADRVEILSVKSQIVSGVKHFLTLVFTTEDGTRVKQCEAEVWSKPWLKFRKVLSMHCDTAREAKEVFTEEHEIKNVTQKFVRNVVIHTMKALNDLYKNPNLKMLNKAIKKASLKQTINGPLYEFVLDVESVECLKNWNKDGSCDEKFRSSVRELCKVLVSDHSRILPQKPFKVVHSQCSKHLNTVSLQRKKRHDIGGHHDYNLDADTRLAELSVSELEHRLGSDYMLKIVRVLDSRVQVVSGRLYHLTLEVGTTECHLNSVKRRSECEVDQERPHRICEIQFWEKAWLKSIKMTNYTCTLKMLGESFWDSLDAEDSLMAEKFRSWMNEHGKSYESDNEMQRRFDIFKNNMRKIKFLQKTEQGTAVYGPTKFADLETEEFKRYLGFRPSKQPYSPPEEATIPDITLPESWDWRKYNVVTHVKDQGLCGSCWAFSVTGNVEGQYGVHHNKLYDLSEQELVDCDKVDDGCQGGYMLDAYKAVMRLGGLESERAYPYRAHRQNCHFNKTMVKVSIKSSVNITKNETGMAKWLVKNGPISIGINANAMQFYFGGVSHPWKVLCDPTNIDHGVLLVGYGVHTTRFLKKHVPYWIVKNSWGPGWGEQGYYRVYRGDGTCGVNQYATSAVV